MISITIVKLKENIVTIEATGHSGYAESGHDIVCAVVSTLTQNLINGLEKVVRLNVKSIVDEDIPHLSVSLPRDITTEQNRLAQVLMQTTYLGLIDARDSFKKFIKIKEIHDD